MIKTAHKIIATFFYSGYFPVAPGTFGSLIALLVWLFLPAGFLVKGLLLFGIIVLGYGATQGFIAELNVQDPGFIVIDEVAGLWLTLFLINVFNGSAVAWSVTGFVLFRLFDILKPYPISRVEKYEGALGIMLDDLVAGIFAALITLLIFYIA